MNYSYRKKPIIIEAFQLTRDRIATLENLDKSMLVGWPDWLIEALEGEIDEPGTAQLSDTFNEVQDLEIVTLEGNHLVRPDDWIIKGVKGELYPCKPDIFAMTYELCEDSAPLELEA